MNHLLRISSMMTVLLIASLPCNAQLYKYQKDGVWYFTDTPPKDVLQQSEVIAGSEDSAPAPLPDGTPLLENHPVHSPLERAAAATVAVKGGLGYGSGFFITNSGYILTNKHVIRTTRDQEKNEQEFFTAVDSKVKEAEAELAAEKQRLDGFASKLKELKRLAEIENDPLRKKSYEDEYTYRNKTFQEAQADYDNRCRQFEAEKKPYMSQTSDYKYGQLVANLAQSFEIILADNTRLNARLVATSKNHDLALLKLDGYKTPALKVSNPGTFFPGLPLYAIGNPAMLKNSITSGIFSGFEGEFIKTNAQIYPGNSGGPWSR